VNERGIRDAVDRLAEAVEILGRRDPGVLEIFKLTFEAREYVGLHDPAEDDDE
jgi:hypothetical protein